MDISDATSTAYITQSFEVVSTKFIRIFVMVFSMAQWLNNNVSDILLEIYVSRK